MQFDAALAAQDSFRLAEPEIGPDWDRAVELEEVFSAQAGPAAREAYEALLELGARYPRARSFQAFCIYITWQQATEETLPRYFQAGARLCEAYLASRDADTSPDCGRITEMYRSFLAVLGLEEVNEIEEEFRRDTPKGGD